jgi:2-oxo-4-hydroxy-4-carboxy-5-ureidoimidazoline decarboxylase
VAEPHAVLNAQGDREAGEALRRACGSERWVQDMLALRPFASTPALLEAAERTWRALGVEDHLEAFRHHPQIGEDMAELARRFASTADLSAAEQAGVHSAGDSTLLALRDANRAYRQRFGFIFIICATGKSAAEMLAALQARLPHDRATELATAAGEQARITRLRLERLDT